ncbi:eCIS core domain-containing protein [Mycobacterium sp.]|uniref:eCIS core domain-containing protein n=1 Tax=Mycobacterium sp. TaxID=1785 RepID=UPI003F9D0D2E
MRQFLRSALSAAPVTVDAIRHGGIGHTVVAARRSASWDFSRPPAFGGDQPNGLRTPIPVAAPPRPSNIQRKLAIGRTDDPLELEADRVAEQVMRMPDPSLRVGKAPLQISRKCAECDEEDERKKQLQMKPAAASPAETGQARGVLHDVLRSHRQPPIGVAPLHISRKCAACEEEVAGKQKLQMKPATASPPQSGEVPGVVHDVLRSQGQPLDAGIRAFFEPRFGRNLSTVRIHTDPQAAQSAQEVKSLAYTVGHNIVFAAQRYAPTTPDGRRLLAHELAHVLQQGAVRRAPAADGTAFAPHLQRQDDGTDNDGAGGPAAGEGQGAAAFVPPPVTAPAPADAYVCGRRLNYPGLNLVFNHAYVNAPPDNYAIVAPLCTPTDGGFDNLILGTAAHKWDNSCDPGAAVPECIACRPKRGVTDVKKCLRNAYTAYNSPTMHKATGPNSNTFAFTLASACCADITTTPPFSSGNYPGWGDPPAPTRPATCPGGPPDCS